MAVTAQAIAAPGPDDWDALRVAAGSRGALESIRRRWQRGEATLMRISGDCAGRVVLWFEIRTDRGRELVAGLGAGTNARAWVRWLIDLAKSNGAVSIRTHCSRAGLIRLYQNAGFVAVGTDNEGQTILRWSDGRQK